MAENLLLAWQISAGVRLNRTTLKFRFERSESTYFDPEIGREVIQIAANVPDIVEVALNVTMPLVALPSPPNIPYIEPKVQALWHRYSRFLEGKAELLPVAYSCLTILEGKRGNREAAATALAIDFQILNAIGTLSSERGTMAEARKFRSSNTELRKDEELWLKNALKAIVLHLLEPPSGKILTPEQVEPRLDLERL